MTGVELLQKEVAAPTEKFALYVEGPTGEGKFVYTNEGDDDSVSFDPCLFSFAAREAEHEIGSIARFCSIHIHPLETEKQMIGTSDTDVDPRQDVTNSNAQVFIPSSPLSDAVGINLLLTKWGVYTEQATSEEILHFVPSYKEQGNDMEEHLLQIDKSVQNVVETQIDDMGSDVYRTWLTYTTGISADLLNVTNDDDTLTRVVSLYVVNQLRHGHKVDLIDSNILSQDFSQLQKEINDYLSLRTEQQKNVVTMSNQTGLPRLVDTISGLNDSFPDVVHNTVLPPELVRKMEEAYAQAGVIMRYVQNDEFIREPACAGAKYGRE